MASYLKVENGNVFTIMEWFELEETLKSFGSNPPAVGGDTFGSSNSSVGVLHQAPSTPTLWLPWSHPRVPFTSMSSQKSSTKKTQLIETLITARCAAIPRWKLIALSQSFSKWSALLTKSVLVTQLVYILSDEYSISKATESKRSKDFLYIQCKHSPYVGVPNAVIIEHIYI